MNDVLDEGLPLHPLQEQRDSVRDWRQCGLGIFGLADMLIKMEIRYGSPEAIDICDKIGYLMAYQAIQTSSKLAELYGTYPKYDEKAVSMSAFWAKHVPEEDRERIASIGLHNSQLLTVAPTGTLSSMFGVSGGIEPIFANYYTRKTESLHGHDEYYKVYTPIVKKYMDEHGISDDSNLPDYFVTAQNLDFRERIAMQSIWQEHIDASISSTVNVPNDFTVEQVEDLYILAWESGLKGVTIFRNGCKRMGILTTDKKETGDKKEDKNAITKASELKRGMIIKANDDCIGKKRTLHTGCGTLHCEAFFDPISGELLETYFSRGSKGVCEKFMVGLSRMISLAARGGIDIYSIVDQLKSSGTCPSYAVKRAVEGNTSKGSSCPVAIGNALIDMYDEMQKDVGNIDEEENNNKPVEVVKPKIMAKKPTIKTATCPECGGNLIYEGGCCSCIDCGYSRCS